jgi:hypothetical protein
VNRAGDFLADLAIRRAEVAVLEATRDPDDRTEALPLPSCRGDSRFEASDRDERREISVAADQDEPACGLQRVADVASILKAEWNRPVAFDDLSDDRAGDRRLEPTSRNVGSRRSTPSNTSTMPGIFSSVLAASAAVRSSIEYSGPKSCTSTGAGSPLKSPSMSWRTWMNSTRRPGTSFTTPRVRRR